MKEISDVATPFALTTPFIVAPVDVTEVGLEDVTVGAGVVVKKSVVPEVVPASLVADNR